MKIMSLDTKQSFRGAFPTLRGGNPEKDYTDIVARERKAAGLVGLPPEVGIQTERCWYYWAVRTLNPLPLNAAQRLNATDGKVIRAFGVSGGLDARKLPSWAKSGVNAWHVDTTEGLKKLVGILKANAATVLKRKARQLERGVKK